MQNNQYDPRLAGYVRALHLARSWTDPSWKTLVLVGFVAAPAVHFLTDSMAWLVGIAFVGFLPLVVCIATDLLVGMKLSVLTTREEFLLLQQAVDHEVARSRDGESKPTVEEPVVKLPSVGPAPRVLRRESETQGTGTS